MSELLPRQVDCPPSTHPPTHPPTLLLPWSPSHAQRAKAGQDLPLGAAVLWSGDRSTSHTDGAVGKTASLTLPPSKGSQYEAPMQEQLSVSPRIEAVHSSVTDSYARV